MKRFTIVAIVAGAALGIAACDERLPTFTDGDLLPVLARTVEVRLPFEQFAKGLQVLGGYGRASSLPSVIVARRFGGTLDARALVRYGTYPSSATVTDTTGASRTDNDLTFVGGRVLVRIDTASVRAAGPVTFVGGALQKEWDPTTATWTEAVDSVGSQLAWDEPGAGTTLVLDTAVWTPSEGDSVLLEVDSATVAGWGDATDAGRGFRLEALTEDVRLDVISAQLWLDTRPSVNPDTIIVLPVSTESFTFIYDPRPPPPANGLRVGGAPAWRTVLEFDLPRTLSPSPEFCAEVACPFTIDPDAVTLASLILQSEPTDDPAFRPVDTLFMDVRAVLSPERLPKAPLGPSLSLFARDLPPEVFEDGGSAQVAITVTSFVQNLLEDDPDQPYPAPTNLALLSSVEPFSFEYATFQGPGGPGAPVLRLLITVADSVGLP